MDSIFQLQVIARQRNEAQRAVFRRLVSAFRKEQLIFLDESSKDERTTQVNLHGCSENCPPIKFKLSSMVNSILSVLMTFKHVSHLCRFLHLQFAFPPNLAAQWRLLCTPHCPSSLEAKHLCLEI